MKESITIKNLGPLRDISIDELRPLTVLIGASGSGKSMLMKVISLMRYLYKKANVRAYLANSGIRRSPFKVRLDSVLHDELRYYILKEGVEIIYTVTADSGRSYVVSIANKKLQLPKTIDDHDLIFTKEAWISETRNVIPMWKNNPANSKGWLGFFFHETLADFEAAAANERHIGMRFINADMTISLVNGTRRFMLNIAGTDEPIELRFASSGMQTAAPLSTVAQYYARSISFKDAKRRSVLNYLYDSDRLSNFHPQIELSDIRSIINMHVEEPELCLDPSAQIRLVAELADTTLNHAQNEISLTFATHSPYIVNALNLFICKRQDGSTLIPHEKLAVYRLANGNLINLMSTDEQGRPIVDTSDLSAPMENIYTEYLSLIGE